MILSLNSFLSAEASSIPIKEDPTITTFLAYYAYLYIYFISVWFLSVSTLSRLIPLIGGIMAFPPVANNNLS